jgi:hypothetical protein
VAVAGGEGGGDEASGAAAREPGGGGSGDDSDADEAAMSKKKRRLANQMKIAELKQQCERPDVVEVWDVTAMDPKLLVYLKVGCRRSAEAVFRGMCRGRNCVKDEQEQQVVQFEAWTQPSAGALL